LESGSFRYSMYSQAIAHDKGFGALGRNRTCDQEIRRLLLYPLSYEGECAWVGGFSSLHRPSSCGRESGPLGVNDGAGDCFKHCKVFSYSS
jgi:hypothetical protein